MFHCTANETKQSHFIFIFIVSYFVFFFLLYGLFERFELSTKTNNKWIINNYSLIGNPDNSTKTWIRIVVYMWLHCYLNCASMLTRFRYSILIIIFFSLFYPFFRSITWSANEIIEISMNINRILFFIHSWLNKLLFWFWCDKCEFYLVFTRAEQEVSIRSLGQTRFSSILME